MLKYELEDLTEVDEAVHSLYTEKDGKYVLTVEGLPEPEDTTGLKNKLNELMSEAKEAKRKARELESIKERQEEESAKEKGEFKQLWEQAQQKLSEKDEELSLIQKRIQEKDINLAAHSIGSQLAKSDTKRAEVLSDYAAKYARHNGEKVEFILGGVAISETDLMNFLKKEYPFLVDGSSASGGGASSASGSGASKEMNRAEFSKLTPQKQMAFIKDGGIVED